MKVLHENGVPIATNDLSDGNAGSFLASFRNATT
jgi:hypothetical protein